jgi:hypothetical protein
VFGFDFVDWEGCEIYIITHFYDVTDEFQGLVEFGEVYMVSDDHVKVANPSYNHSQNPR